MALKVTQLQLWSGQIEDKPGGAAKVLEPLAQAKVNLGFVIVRRTPEAPGKGVMFVAPIQGAKAEEAARAAGLSPTGSIAGLRVEGDDRPGAGYAMTRAIADAGISFRGLSAHVLGKKFVCLVAFDSAEDAGRAKEAIRTSQKK
jgi:hypothetical protein